jgi:hypothetical protein
MPIPHRAAVRLVWFTHASCSMQLNLTAKASKPLPVSTTAKRIRDGHFCRAGRAVSHMAPPIRSLLGLSPCQGNGLK